MCPVAATPPITRITYKIDENGCWICKKATRPDGYGVVGQYNRVLRAHRVTYEHFVGPIPVGLVLDHLCRVRSCCNPDHLEPVTRAVNNARAMRTHCRRGHLFSGDNLRINPKKGDRACRACDRIRRREKHVKKPQINCCVVAEKTLTIEIVQPKAKPMEITVTVNAHPSTSPIAIQQWMDWAMRIEAGSADPQTTEAAKPNGKTPAAAPSKEQELFNQLVATKKETAPPPPPALVAEAAAADETDGEETDETEAETVPQTGAVPPGITAPPKRRGGRPSKAMIAEREAAAAAAAAAVNPALLGAQQQQAPAPSNGAMPLNVSPRVRLPGMGATPDQPGPQLQQPAMPPQEEFSDGTTTKADVQGCYTAAASHDPKGVRALLQSSTWPDGTQKPRWFTIDMVVPTFYDRLFNELGALIPAEG